MIAYEHQFTCVPARQDSRTSPSFSSVETKTLAGFLATLFLLFLAGAFTYRATVEEENSAQRVNHSQLVRASLGRLYGAISDAESQQRNYLLSAKAEYLADYRRVAESAEPEAQRLVQLVSDNPAQSVAVRQLQSAIVERLAILEQTVSIFESSGLAQAQETISHGEGREAMEAIRSLIRRIDSAEDDLLKTRYSRASAAGATTLIYLLVTVTVAAAGFVLLFGGIRRELRMRAKADEATRLNEENLTVTLHSIGDAVLVTDAERRITRMNPVCEKLTGWPQEEAMGRRVEEIFCLINKETGQPTSIPVEAALATGEIHSLENQTVLIARDGTERPIADSAAPIRDGDGHIIGAVLVFRDVTREKCAETELRRSRALFEGLFTSLPGHFLVLSSDHKIVAASDAYLKATMTRREEIVGRNLFEVFPDNPNDPEATGVANLRASLNRVRLTAAADTMPIIKYDIRRPDGVFEERFWSPMNAPVLGADGQIEYIIHRAEDVTDFVRQKSKGTNDTSELRIHMERMEAEVFQSAQKAQAAKEQLEAANKELEAFSYSVSHDLRAPLRHVHGYVQMLAKATEGQLSPKAARYLKVIDDASVEMGQLIDDLLSFSRMGRAEMREHSVDLNRIVEDTLRGLELATKGRNIQWKIAALPSVLGDSAMLRQVFSNLLGNAVKYTRGREPAEIEVGCAGEEGAQIVFFVLDNGAGFDMEYAHKLFGVFQRLHRAEEFEGTGIGLATVQRILARHGGRIWAEAKLDQGAKFSFTLKPAPAP